MKTDIHPEYQEIKAQCACGTTHNVASTKKSIEVEICSACHPFYTGKEKLIDAAGRVEKFRAKLAKRSSPKKKAK